MGRNLAVSLSLSPIKFIYYFSSTDLLTVTVIEYSAKNWTPCPHPQVFNFGGIFNNKELLFYERTKEIITSIDLLDFDIEE